MTKKPLSTISFNTGDYLDAQLQRLYQNNILAMYIYIKHYPEKDTTKEHYHVYIQPYKTVNPQEIRSFFVEPQTDGVPPLGCLPFVPAKLYDWLLYACHDIAYLTSKGLTRINHYPITDIVSSEPYYCIEQFWRDAHEQQSQNRIAIILDMLCRGDSYGDILSSGLIPPNQVIFYDKLIKTKLASLVKTKEINEDIPF